MKLKILGALAALCTLAIAPIAAAQPAGGATGIGTPNDAAWSGSGQGTVVAINKAMRNLLAGTLTVNLPSGAASAANQTTGNSSLSSIDTKLTGVATAANQGTGNTSLSSIDTKLSTLHSDLIAATPAGTAIIGKVGLDQTTPGTTNGVTIAPSSASAVGIAAVASSAAEACHVLKAAAGNLYGVSGTIGAAGWIMIFNATSAPADGAVTPVAWAQPTTSGSWAINYGTIPLALSTGITVCASSTGPFTKTAYSTSTVFSGRVQ